MQKHVILREIIILIFKYVAPQVAKKELYYNEENDHSGFAKNSGFKLGSN